MGVNVDHAGEWHGGGWFLLPRVLEILSGGKACEDAKEKASKLDTEQDQGSTNVKGLASIGGFRSPGTIDSLRRWPNW